MSISRIVLRLARNPYHPDVYEARSRRAGLVALCALAASASLAACGSDSSPEKVQESLKAVTASALTDVDASGVEVVSSEQSAAKWIWTAKAGGKTYLCDADNLMRLPSCNEQE